MNYSVTVFESVPLFEDVPFPEDITFLSSPPIISRSIFTDKGPIAKPPVTLQNGTGATLDSAMTVTLPGGSFTSVVVGLRLTLAGPSLNAGDYLILSVISANKLKVRAAFSTPDPLNGSIAWSVYAPRDGVIADSPLDVKVRINGTSVLPVKVAGLIGQIVLPSTPSPTDDVQVDYSWVPDPTVEFRRLNSLEFTLNGGRARVNRTTQHSYPYSCVLIRPSNYVPAVDPQAGMGPVFTTPTQVTLPGASLNSTHVGLYLRVTGLGVKTYRIVSVISPTECVVSPT
jgi:hypothetical protein